MIEVKELKQYSFRMDCEDFNNVEKARQVIKDLLRTMDDYKCDTLEGNYKTILSDNDLNYVLDVLGKLLYLHCNIMY